MRRSEFRNIFWPQIGLFLTTFRWDTIPSTIYYLLLGIAFHRATTHLILAAVFVAVHAWIRGEDIP